MILVLIQEEGVIQHLEHRQARFEFWQESPKIRHGHGGGGHSSLRCPQRTGIEGLQALAM